MYNKGKSPVIILIVLIAVSLALAVAVFFALQQEKSKGMKLRAELADVKTAQKITESKLEESKKTIAAIELKLKEAQAQIDTLNSDLAQEKAATQEAAAQSDMAKKELESQKQKRADLEKRLSDEQKSSGEQASKMKSLDNRRIQLESRIKELEAKLEEYSTKVDLGTVVVAPEAGAPQAATKTAAGRSAAAQPKAAAQSAPAASQGSSLQGKLLVVNRDYNFVVINMGTKDGVRVGDVFSVYHAGKYAGDVKVDKVHDSMAAAGFASADMKDKVSEGDKVEAKSK